MRTAIAVLIKTIKEGGFRMDITLRPLSVNDGSDIYEMLQEIPAK